MWQNALYRYLDDTSRDKAFYHMIIIQVALLLARWEGFQIDISIWNKAMFVFQCWVYKFSLITCSPVPYESPPQVFMHSQDCWWISMRFDIFYILNGFPYILIVPISIDGFDDYLYFRWVSMISMSIENHQNCKTSWNHQKYRNHRKYRKASKPPNLSKAPRISKTIEIIETIELIEIIKNIETIEIIEIIETVESSKPSKTVKPIEIIKNIATLSFPRHFCIQKYRHPRW